MSSSPKRFVNIILSLKGPSAQQSDTGILIIVLVVRLLGTYMVIAYLDRVLKFDPETPNPYNLFTVPISLGAQHFQKHLKTRFWCDGFLLDFRGALY